MNVSNVVDNEAFQTTKSQNAKRIQHTMHLTKEAILKLDRIKRINIINSVSGIKPANLIGTKSKSGNNNLAIFSSVVHLGSTPGYFGFIMRPTGEVRRDTYDNIMETGVFTINHIHASFAEQGHYTSAKFDADVSEFETCGLSPEFKLDFEAPFVKESTLKMALKHVETVPIKATNTIMVIGEIQHLFFPDSSMNEDGMIDLEALDDIGISGLNTYYQLKKMASYPFARATELPNFDS